MEKGHGLGNFYIDKFFIIYYIINDIKTEIIKPKGKDSMNYIEADNPIDYYNRNIRNNKNIGKHVHHKELGHGTVLVMDGLKELFIIKVPGLKIETKPWIPDVGYNM